MTTEILFSLNIWPPLLTVSIILR